MSKPNGQQVADLDFFRNLNDRQPVPVFVEQWHRTVYLVPLSSQQALDHQMLIAQAWKKIESGRLQQMPDFKSEAVGECLTDAEGKRIFEKRSDFDLLKKANGAAVALLYDKLQAISGTNAQAIEDATKNSQATTDFDSSSGLRSLSDAPLAS